MMCHILDSCPPVRIERWLASTTYNITDENAVILMATCFHVMCAHYH